MKTRIDLVLVLATITACSYDVEQVGTAPDSIVVSPDCSPRVTCDNRPTLAAEIAANGNRWPYISNDSCGSETATCWYVDGCSLCPSALPVCSGTDVEQVFACSASCATRPGLDVHFETLPTSQVGWQIGKDVCYYAGQCDECNDPGDCAATDVAGVVWCK